MMKRFLLVMLGLCLISMTQASMVTHLDFNVKNTPYTVDDYTDVTGNGYNGDEAGTWWNFDGDTNPNADLWDNAGGARGGVYAHRTAYEQYYETQVRIGNAENNRVTLASTPTIAANAGITLALWVNPEEDHVIYGNIAGGDPLFAHLIALGGYGDTRIVSIELDSNKRVHGWFEGDLAGNDQVEITGTGSVAANAWTHIAITFDRVNNVATTYINGVADKTTNISLVGDGVLNFNNSSSIGGGFYDFGHHDSYLGMMDDVMIFDHALDATEVAALVPEPATLILLGLGGLIGIRRKR